MRPLQDFIDKDSLGALIKAALEEDLGPGDVTSLALIPDERQARARLLVKGSGVLAGLPVFGETFRVLDENVTVSLLKQDGERVKPGEVAAIVQGPARSLLSGERTALNFVGLLSGIASGAAHLSGLTAGKGPTLLDTRKTVPLLRDLSKYAVQVGGCANHRRGLYDMILIKENHLRAAGSIREAVARCRSAWPNLAVEVETTNLDEVREALEAGADRIMFDNMDDTLIREALTLTRGRCESEASGNMDADRIRALAGSGLDYISLGSLTSNVQCLDVSLLFERD